MTFLLTLSVFSFAALRVFDSHSPAKWPVFKCSHFLPTADCYLKYSPRICTRERIYSLTFLPHRTTLTTSNKRNLHGYTRFLPHHLPDTLLVHHPLPSQFPPLAPCIPPPHCFCLSLPIPAPWDLGQCQICPSPEPSWATVAEAAAQQYIVEVFVPCRKTCPSILPSISFQEILSYLVFLFKTFPSTAGKGIDHFKKQQIASSHNPIHTLLRIIAGTPWDWKAEMDT